MNDSTSSAFMIDDKRKKKKIIYIDYLEEKETA